MLLHNSPLPDFTGRDRQPLPSDPVCDPGPGNCFASIDGSAPLICHTPGLTRSYQCVICTGPPKSAARRQPRTMAALNLPLKAKPPTPRLSSPSSPAGCRPLAKSVRLTHLRLRPEPPLAGYKGSVMPRHTRIRVLCPRQLSHPRVTYDGLPPPKLVYPYGRASMNAFPRAWQVYGRARSLLFPALLTPPLTSSYCHHMSLMAAPPPTYALSIHVSPTTVSPSARVLLCLRATLILPA
ncbi:hypothetical protein BDV93DRAFT_559778 [Ceratobasidium sp. AG-I]|nr:hypothetical protein BDV93DRAFT_559778 [Ceratobasidium sp. AG-I]